VTDGTQAVAAKPGRIDAGPLQIVLDDPRGTEIRALLEEHLRHMHSRSPPESVHALDLDALRRPEISFWTGWSGGVLRDGRHQFGSDVRREAKRDVALGNVLLWIPRPTPVESELRRARAVARRIFMVVMLRCIHRDADVAVPLQLAGSRQDAGQHQHEASALAHTHALLEELP